MELILPVPVSLWEEERIWRIVLILFKSQILTHLISCSNLPSQYFQLCMYNYLLPIAYMVIQISTCRLIFGRWFIRKALCFRIRTLPKIRLPMEAKGWLLQPKHQCIKNSTALCTVKLAQLDRCPIHFFIFRLWRFFWQGIIVYSYYFNLTFIVWFCDGPSSPIVFIPASSPWTMRFGRFLARPEIWRSRCLRGRRNRNRFEKQANDR